jgi:hypothetical protein
MPAHSAALGGQAAASDEGTAREARAGGHEGQNSWRPT